VVIFTSPSLRALAKVSVFSVFEWFALVSVNVCVSPNPHRLTALAQLVGAGLCRAAFPMESGRVQGIKEP